MDISGLKAILCVGQLKNYMDAADALSVSPSTLSKQIAGVEEELGVTIFTRATKSKPAELTPEGLALIAPIEKAVGAYTDVFNRANTLKSNVMYDLIVGYIPGLGAFATPKLLSTMALENRDIRIHVTAENPSRLMDYLHIHTVDAVLMTLSEWDMEPGSGLSKRIFNPDIDLISLRATDELYLAVNNCNPLAAFDEIGKEQLGMISDMTILFNEKSCYVNHIDRICNYFNAGKQWDFLFLDFDMTGVVYAALLGNTNIVVPVIGTKRRDNPEWKYIKVKDWSIRTFQYLVTLRENNTKPVRVLKKYANEYE